MHAFYGYSYSENAIYQCEPTANLWDIVQYIVLHPLFSTKAFLIKLFENFGEQVEDFFNVTSDSFVKNSAIQPKSNIAFKLKYFNLLNVAVIPLVWLYHFSGIPILCENSSYSLKAHWRANCPTWHCQVWHVLSFSYISRPVLLKADKSSWSTSQ